MSEAIFMGAAIVAPLDELTDKLEVTIPSHMRVSWSAVEFTTEQSMGSVASVGAE